LKALNDILPASIRVLDVAEMPPQFHARHSAQSKNYRYRIYRGAICPPFLARYVWHYPYPLHEEAMIQAAEFVVGEKDFTSFAAVDPERVRDGPHIAVPSGASVPRSGSDAHSRDVLSPVSNVRTIFSSTWDRRGEELIYEVRGSGFLHHMVRNLVGTSILIGKRTLQPEDVTRILEARSRSAAGATAPASGLYLVTVEY
jgi:tRNA pseudouridine38-40 synthase